MRVFHVAGEPVELVQRCERCRIILVDNNGAMIAGDDTRPMYFPAYRLIEGEGNWLGQAPDDISGDEVRARMCVALALGRES